MHGNKTKSLPKTVLYIRRCHRDSTNVKEDLLETTSSIGSVSGQIYNNVNCEICESDTSHQPDMSGNLCTSISLAARSIANTAKESGFRWILKSCRLHTPKSSNLADLANLADLPNLADLAGAPFSVPENCISGAESSVWTIDQGCLGCNPELLCGGM